MFDPKEAAKIITGKLTGEFASRGFNKAVIGLSGGVDSAVSAALAVRALGKENVTVVHMPYRTSNLVHLEDAKKVARNIGIAEANFLIRDITSAVESFFLADPTIAESKVRVGNISARCRMITLFDLAKKESALVVGTENRTENIFGYYTRYGDAASDIEPITALLKTQVWEIAKYLGLPREVIEKAPSADLWAGQTDEDELGVTYLEADEILTLLFDEGLSNEAVVERGHQRKVVEKVLAAIEKNSFKKDLPVLIAV